MDGSIRIVALKNNEPVGAWEFEKESVSIGRSKTADVRLDDPAISRVHCIIETRSTGVYVKDCGSRNGIWVAGRRVQEAMLSSRDEVVVEHYRIKAYMVWGNTVANRFADRVEEKTRVPGASRLAPGMAARDLARDGRPSTSGAKPTAQSSRQNGGGAAPAGRAPVKPSLAKTETPVAKPARPVAKPQVVVEAAIETAKQPVPARRAAPAPAPAAASLEATNAMPEHVRPMAARGTVSAEVEDILADVRPAPRAPRAERVERVERPQPAERAEPAQAAKPAPKAARAAAPAKPQPPRPTRPAPAVAKKSAPVATFLFDSDDDDEDEEETLPPAFSMIDTLAASRTRRPVDGKAVIEVVRYRGENVLDVTRVDRGGRYEIPFSGATLVELGDGEARVHANGLSGELKRATGSKSIRGAAALRYGEVADLMGDDGIGYMIRFTEPMAPSRNAPLFAAAAAAAIIGSTGASVGLHTMFGMAMIVLDMIKPEEPEWSDFATIEMEEPEEELAAAPTPTPAPTPEAKPTPPPPPQKLAKAPERLSKKPVPNRQRVGGADRTEAKVASAGVLGGLGKLDVKIDSKSPALAAVTNLDAIKSTGGKRGGFRVSALTGKVPGDVRMGRAGRANGTVDISTLNTKDLGGQALGGFGGRAKKGGGKVKGVVTRVPTQNVGVQGSLTRAQIAAVVNKHINEIRHCYEKNLINDPGLAGKIQVEWTINPDGSVQAVKTKFSSMRGGNVTGCIAGRIRTWQFPRPKGNGYVIVNYPFMFDSVGF